MSNGADTTPENPSSTPRGALSIASNQNVDIKQLSESVSSLVTVMAQFLAEQRKTNEERKDIEGIKVILEAKTAAIAAQKALQESRDLDLSEKDREFRKKYKEIEERSLQKRLEEGGDISSTLVFVTDVVKRVGERFGKNIDPISNIDKYFKTQDIENLKKIYPEQFKKLEQERAEDKANREKLKKQEKIIQTLQNALSGAENKILEEIKAREGNVVNVAPALKTVTTPPKPKKEKKPEEITGELEPTTPEKVIEPEQPSETKPAVEGTEPQIYKVELIKINDEVLNKLKEVFVEILSQSEEQAEAGTSIDQRLLDLKRKGRPTPEAPRVSKPTGPATSVPPARPVPPTISSAPVPPGPPSVPVSPATPPAGASGPTTSIGRGLLQQASKIMPAARFIATRIALLAAALAGAAKTVEAGYEFYQMRKAQQQEKESDEAANEAESNLKAAQAEKRGAQAIAEREGRSTFVFRGKEFSVKDPNTRVNATPALTLTSVPEQQTSFSTGVSATPVSTAPAGGTRVESRGTETPGKRLPTAESSREQEDRNSDGRKTIRVGNNDSDILKSILEVLQKNLYSENTGSTIIGSNKTSNSFTYNLNAGTGITSSRKETARTLNKYMDLYI